MFKKRISLGLILLLLLALGGCQAGDVAKDVVFSKQTKSVDGVQKTSHANVPIQEIEAVEKAEAAFQRYFAIQNIDKGLVLKAALIEDDGVLWINPYWKLAWLGKDAKKPIYTAEIDAQTGEVVQLRCRPKWDHKTVSREDVLAYQDKALAFIDKFALVEAAPLSLFEANSSYMEGIFVEFRYAPDKFIMLYFNEAGDVTGFEFSQKVAYTLQGNDLKIDRTQAKKLAQASIKQYFGKADTTGLIEQIQLIESNQGKKTWFVYWKNIAVLEGNHVGYGAQIDALSGKVVAIEGTNYLISNADPKINAEKQREIADRFLQQKNLSDYRFDTFLKDTGYLRYRDKAGSPLNVYVDQRSGNVNFLSFVEFK